MSDEEIRQQAQGGQVQLGEGATESGEGLAAEVGGRSRSVVRVCCEHIPRQNRLLPSVDMEEHPASSKTSRYFIVPPYR